MRGFAESVIASTIDRCFAEAEDAERCSAASAFRRALVAPECSDALFALALRNLLGLSIDFQGRLGEKAKRRA